MKRVDVESQARNLIREFPVLRAFDGQQWERALAGAVVLREEDGARLIHPVGWEHFTIVLRGALKLRVHSEDGRAFSAHKVGAGEVCMLSMSLLQSKSPTMPEVVAEGETWLLRVPAAHLDPLLAHCPGFRDFFIASTTECFGRMLALVEELAFDRLATRIEKYLHRCRSAQADAVIRVTHQQIAQEVGTTREVVSRVLKLMETNGKLRLGRGSITLP